jgi:hypothetical protein
MRATIISLGAVLALALTAPSARAQYCCYPCIPQAPDACWPGFYAPNCCGLMYGPNYCLRPPFPPFQGMVPGPPPGRNGPGGPGGQGGIPTFPTHPFARSPRDYFMID